MQKKIVAVLDTASGVFGTPFFVPAVGAAIRSFSDEVNRNDKENNLNKHPKDFSLWDLGTYDDTLGVISGAPAPALIVHASAVLEPKGT